MSADGRLLTTKRAFQTSTYFKPAYLRGEFGRLPRFWLRLGLRLRGT